MTREKEIEQAADEHFAHSWKGSVVDAFAEGAQWADQHPKDNLDINFPKYDNIVDKVFGAGNLECWEYDQAKQLVKLAKDELLLELKEQEKQQWIERAESVCAEMFLRVESELFKAGVKNINNRKEIEDALEIGYKYFKNAMKGE